MAGPNLRKFQMRVAEIERDAAAGLIGNEMRRSLLVQARDQYGVSDLAGRATYPQQSGKLTAMNDNQINQQKNPHRPRKRGPAPA